MQIQATLIGDFSSACAFKWGDDAGRLSLTIQPDPNREQFSRLNATATSGGLVEAYNGVGEAALSRMDGSLLWIDGADAIFTLNGHNGGAGNLIAIEQLAQLAEAINHKR